MEDDEKMAEILGVATDADERTIKVAYRKLALKFRK
jgi:curved DNA-binding protein CbpA